MKQTAILHSVFAALVVAGFLVSSETLQLGLFGLGGVFFVAGVVAARRGGDDDTTAVGDT